MNKNRLQQYLSGFDLVAISAWALFTLWHLKFASFLMPVMILLRLAISFALSHRQKNTAWLIAVFTVLFFLLLGLQPTNPNETLLRPLSKMYDCLVNLFQGHSTMLEGAFHYWVIMEIMCLFLVMDGLCGHCCGYHGLSWNQLWFI